MDKNLAGMCCGPYGLKTFALCFWRMQLNIFKAMAMKIWSQAMEEIHLQSGPYKEQTLESSLQFFT